MQEPDDKPSGQPELPLPFPEFTGDMPPLPARMVNEYQYCSRLAYLEWVQCDWAELTSRRIPVTWMSHGGWFTGHTIGAGHRNVELRTAQYRASFDERRCLTLAKGLVEGGAPSRSPSCSAWAESRGLIEASAPCKPSSLARSYPRRKAAASWSFTPRTLSNRPRLDAYQAGCFVAGGSSRSRGSLR